MKRTKKRTKARRLTTSGPRRPRPAGEERLGLVDVVFPIGSLKHSEDPNDFGTEFDSGFETEFSTDGALELDATECHCPVCVDNARRGVPRVIMGPDGEILELPPLELPPMIEVTVFGSASTWPELAADPQTLEVPVGCSVFDLLAFLQYRNEALMDGFGPGSLRALADGVECEPQRVVRPGESFRIVGSRDRRWREALQEVTPPPRPRAPSTAETN